MVLSDEILRESVELWFPLTAGTVVFPEKRADVKEYDDQKIESVERLLFDWETPVAVGGVAALDLHPHLCHFAPLWLMAWLRVDADQVVAFVVRRGLVGEDIPSHQVAHHEKLGTLGHNRKTKPFLFRHLLLLIPRRLLASLSPADCNGQRLNDAWARNRERFMAGLLMLAGLLGLAWEANGAVKKDRLVEAST